MCRPLPVRGFLATAQGRAVRDHIGQQLAARELVKERQASTALSGVLSGDSSLSIISISISITYQASVQSTNHQYTDVFCSHGHAFEPNFFLATPVQFGPTHPRKDPTQCLYNPRRRSFDHGSFAPNFAQRSSSKLFLQGFQKPRKRSDSFLLRRQPTPSNGGYRRALKLYLKSVLLFTERRPCAAC